MNVQEIIEPKCVQAQRELKDKDAALRHIASLAAQSPKLASISEDEIYQALKDREEVGTTGFGDGIAIPHCRRDNVRDFVLGLVSVPDGVEFEALDGEPTRLLVFIVGPQDDSRRHVRLLSGISQVLMDPSVVKELLSVKSDEALLESFRRHLSDDLEPDEHHARNTLQLCIQNEDLFYDVLKVFVGMPQCSFYIVEANNASAYLANMPLFAGFWKEEKPTFGRLICANINQKMSNELIRRIERVTGSLDDRQDMLLTVYQAYYSSGALGH